MTTPITTKKYKVTTTVHAYQTWYYIVEAEDAATAEELVMSGEVDPFDSSVDIDDYYGPTNVVEECIDDESLRNKYPANVEGSDDFNSAVQL